MMVLSGRGIGCLSDVVGQAGSSPVDPGASFTRFAPVVRGLKVAGPERPRPALCGTDGIYETLVVCQKYAIPGRFLDQAQLAALFPHILFPEVHDLHSQEFRNGAYFPIAYPDVTLVGARAAVAACLAFECQAGDIPGICSIVCGSGNHTRDLPVIGRRAAPGYFHCSLSRL